jgi:ornithine--oxo-acid transaminase
MGCGKTGKFLCSDWMGAENKPDIVTMGKSITGGAYPASYILGRAEIMDQIGHYQSVASYGQTPGGIAATRAALKIMDEEDLVSRAVWIGKIWQEETAGWKYPWVDFITNRGADLNITLKPTNDPQINGERLGMLCFHKGLLIHPDHNRMRMGVALNIPEQDLRRGIAIIQEALEELPNCDVIDIGPPIKGVVPVM